MLNVFDNFYNAIFEQLLGPHDGGLLDILWPDAGGPISNSQEILWKEGVPLEGVNGAMVSAVHAYNRIICGL